MKNLEQIRAASVIRAANTNEDFQGQEGGESTAKKIPSLIINHGLLQCLAFAKEKGKGWAAICDHLATHLSELGIVDNCRDTDALIRTLSEGDSQLLKHATAESLAWFNYARRFLK